MALCAMLINLEWLVAWGCSRANDGCFSAAAAHGFILAGSRQFAEVRPPGHLGSARLLARFSPPSATVNSSVSHHQFSEQWSVVHRTIGICHGSRAREPCRRRPQRSLPYQPASCARTLYSTCVRSGAPYSLTGWCSHNFLLTGPNLGDGGRAIASRNIARQVALRNPNPESKASLDADVLSPASRCLPWEWHAGSTAAQPRAQSRDRDLLLSLAPSPQQIVTRRLHSSAG